MERLTRKRDKKNILESEYYSDCGEKDCVLVSCAFFSPCKTEEALFERLGKIEDILGDTYDPDRLRELVEADQEGRCVVLPKDGMVYYIEEAGGEKWIANKPIQQITVKCGWGIASIEFSLLDSGKYFTREAAEAALKGEQDGKNDHN